MEHDYWRFREAETRYRHLFETAHEAVLIVDGLNQKVLEANPAAREVLGGVRAKLVGTPLPTLFDARSGEPLQNLMASARASGRPAAVAAKLSGTGTEVALSATLFRQQDASFVLVRLVPTEADGGRKGASARSAALGAGEGLEAMLQAFMKHAPDGVVFCDGEGRILSANPAFLNLAQLGTEDQARRQPLVRWLGRTGVELGVLVTNLRQRGSIGLFVTGMRGEYGGVTEVLERRAPHQFSHLTGRPGMARSAGEMAELVGRTPLKDIVSETTDLIEQLCIETALQMTQDNRASAALLLGLSRQSLYVKMRRFGMGHLGADSDGEQA